MMDMTTQIEAFEGRRNEAYPDPVTHGAPWTIGVGHTGPDVYPGLVWDDATIDAVRNADVTEKVRQCHAHFDFFDGLNDPRKAVLVNMCFQMGINGLLKFTNTLKAVAEGRWSDAADGMCGSAWARQTPRRAERLAKQMELGLWV